MSPAEKQQQQNNSGKKNQVKNLHTLMHILICIIRVREGREDKDMYEETSLHSNTSNMPENDLVCPNMKYVKCSKLKITGCPTTSCPMMQCVSQHAFLAVLGHNHLHSISYVTYKSKQSQESTHI